MLLAACLFAARPAAAQWTRVAGVPATSVFSLVQSGDTLLAGESGAVDLSLNGGSTWTHSAQIGTSGVPITAVWIGHGLLWAGSFGQGVFTSGDLGASWQAANTGLVGDGLGSEKFEQAFEPRGDSLYLGTSGVGTFVKKLSTLGPWSVFGPSLVSNVSGNVDDLAHEGDRLMVSANANGYVDFNDRGQPEWTDSFLEVGARGVGLEVHSFAWTGSAWLASSATRIYSSETGADGWLQVGPGVANTNSSRLVSHGGRTFAAFSGFFDSGFFSSPDGGTTWNFLETQPAVVLDLMLKDTLLYAGRTDGLWTRSTAVLAVDPTAAPRGVQFALAGPNPARGATALDLALPAAGRVRVSAMDVAGRTVSTLADGEYPAGSHRLTWEPSGLPPGVYLLRLETPGAARSLRVVLVR